MSRFAVAKVMKKKSNLFFLTLEEDEVPPFTCLFHSLVSYY